MDSDEKSTAAVTPNSLVTDVHVKGALAADKGDQACIKSWSIEDKDVIGRGDNYASVIRSVRVKFSLDGQDSEAGYVVKINPCRHLESFREFTRTIFQKETNFYLTLLPELNSALTALGQQELRFPKCFYGSMDTDRELFFMEDLRVRGFRMVDRQKGLDSVHTTLVLEELARFHAASLLVQAKVPDQNLALHHGYLLKDLTTHNAKDPEALLPMFLGYLRQAEALMSQVGGYERVVSWIESLKPRMREVLEEQLEGGKYNVVCHGDCWSNNILFKYNDANEPVEVMLVDLQMVRHASPATDLTFLLYSSLPGPVRKPNLHTFLSSYHLTVSAIMEAAGASVPLSLSELLQEFKDKTLFGAIYAMIIVPITFLKGNNVPDLSNATNETFGNIMDQFKEKTQEVLNTNPLFRPRLLSLFDELIEVGLIP